jgi:hypothetical protein
VTPLDVRWRWVDEDACERDAEIRAALGKLARGGDP